ncbi:hypothetical protein [Helicobacter sp. T3_23-1059]
MSLRADFLESKPRGNLFIRFCQKCVFLTFYSDRLPRSLRSLSMTSIAVIANRAFTAQQSKIPIHCRVANLLFPPPLRRFFAFYPPPLARGD